MSIGRACEKEFCCPRASLAAASPLEGSSPLRGELPTSSGSGLEVGLEASHLLPILKRDQAFHTSRWNLPLLQQHRDEHLEFEGLAEKAGDGAFFVEGQVAFRQEFREDDDPAFVAGRAQELA